MPRLIVAGQRRIALRFATTDAFCTGLIRKNGAKAFGF
jgi:hypothetical protein